jgi:hydrogenase 3 maturation protease
MSIEESYKEIGQRLAGKRFGVVGVGNTLKGDDGAGPEVIALLEGRIDLPIVDASEVPENYGGWVVKERLESVVFVDAVEFGGVPGEFRIIPLEKLMVSASSTHRLSLHYVIKFLEEEWGGDAILVGVQPKSLTLGDGLSEEVGAGVRALAEALVSAAGGADVSGSS